MVSLVKTIIFKVKMAYIGAPCDMLFDFDLPFSTVQPEITSLWCEQIWAK